MTTRTRLYSITNRILEAPADAFGELFAASEDLYNFLVEITGLDTDQAQHRDQIVLNEGKAIGLTWAAMCIKDFMRTKKFMEGVLEAANSLRVKQNDRAIHIVYAGTGPFATLVLPLFARFAPGQLQCTLIEVNESSFTYLQKTITTLELQPYIRRTVKADATLYTLSATESTDIFISETMNLGLTKEPQVAIYMNMVPQLQKETIIIPQQVTLEAALIHPGKRNAFKMGLLEKDESTEIVSAVFELSKNMVNQTSFTQNGDRCIFPSITITIPAGNQGREFSILTTVIIHKSIALQTDQSAITLPLKLSTVEDPMTFGLSLWYETGPQPGIYFKKQ